MNFYQQLQQQTLADQRDLLSAPIIHICRDKKITKSEYIYFLTQAYHHVKHTVPLLKLCQANLSEEYDWLKKSLTKYIDEEIGHEEWILDDIEVCGGNKSDIMEENPCVGIEEMILYLYEKIENGHPLALFGMVQVLEGTSVSIAGEMANLIQDSLKLPDEAVTYLQSHGAIDQEHLTFFSALMNKIIKKEDQQEIIDSAHFIYKCYGKMLHSVHLSKDAVE